MASYKKGNVVLVPFPFIALGQVQQKLRPALVISIKDIPRRHSDIILSAITSKVKEPLFETEVLVDPREKGFPVTGLAVRSVIKLEMLMTLPEKFVIRKIGELEPELMAKVDKALTKYLGLAR